MAIVSLLLAAALAGLARWRGARAWQAWLLGTAVVPVFVLVSEFALPYQGGGASMWPVALLFGGVLGALSSAAGVLLVSLLLRRRAS